MIIGLIGKAGAGKSTVAEYLASKEWARINMKDALVKEMRENFPDVLNSICGHFEDLHPDFDIDEPWTVDSLFIEKPPIMRALMQNYGTEVRRKDNPNYWIDKWSEAAAEVGGNIVVDDIRFQNELDVVRNLGGKIIKITRTDITDTGSHASETGADTMEFDLEMKCDKGEHEKLYSMVDLFLEEHEG